MAFVAITFAATIRLNVPGPTIALYEQASIVQAISIPIAKKGTIMIALPLSLPDPSYFSWACASLTRWEYKVFVSCWMYQMINNNTIINVELPTM